MKKLLVILMLLQSACTVNVERAQIGDSVDFVYVLDATTGKCVRIGPPGRFIQIVVKADVMCRGGKP